MRLFDANGRPLDNRQYEETLQGGTPFEQGVEIDPNLSKRCAFIH